jgi:RND family efflux transporter MFP subunit
MSIALPSLRAFCHGFGASVVAGFCLGLLVACGNDTPATAVLEDSPPPRQVRVMPAVETEAARSVTATGTLAAEEQIILGTKVVGRLGEINVDFGSRVRRGEVIARIDQSDYKLRVAQAQAALQQARVRLGLPPSGTNDNIDIEETATVREAAAVLKEARLTHDRMVELWQHKFIARAEFDAAVSQLAVAEARYQDAIEEVRNRQAVLVQRRSELEIARQQLSDTVIISPIDGAVRERHASVGQYLAAGAPVVTLVRTDPLRLRLAIPEREAGFVRVGQRVNLTVEGDPNKYHGRVARLSPSIAEDNRTLMIEAEVPNREGVLRPGAFAKADIVVQAGERVITVPQDAIVNFAGIEKVITVEKNVSVEKYIRTGRRLGDRVEIIEGIAAGEQVVLRPGNLIAGEAVTVVR